DRDSSAPIIGQSNECSYSRRARRRLCRRDPGKCWLVGRVVLFNHLDSYLAGNPHAVREIETAINGLASDILGHHRLHGGGTSTSTCARHHAPLGETTDFRSVVLQFLPKARNIMRVKLCYYNIEHMDDVRGLNRGCELSVM